MIDIERSKMISAERRVRIMKLLNDQGYVQVADAALDFGTSPMTIRRDLYQLEMEGVCIRKRGGAVRKNMDTTLELPFIFKQIQNVEVKKRIADAAIAFIEDGNSIILDSGTTTCAIAQLLFVKRHLIVATNDLQIAIKLSTNPDIKTICTGGVSRTNVFSLQGPIAEASLSNMSVDFCFLGADAIHPDGGIYNVNVEEVPIKQAMIRAANKVILVTDSTKFTLHGFAKVCDLSQVNVIITDDQIGAETQEMIRGSFRKEIIMV